MTEVRPTLRARVVEVAEKRAILAVCQERVRASREAWDKANQDILRELKNAQDSLLEGEKDLRLVALILYGETGEKDLSWGVKIRVNQVLNYDPKTALGWALDHRVALTLDKRVFEGLAKAQPLDFVTVGEEAQATIATDLEKVLEEAK